MPLSFISILDEAGSPFSTYPKVDLGPFFGAVISAVSGALSKIGSQSIEHITTNKFHLYTYKTDKGLLLLVAFKKESDREPKKDLVDWFLYNLALMSDEIGGTESFGVTIIEESKGSIFDPLLEKSYNIFNEIEALFNDLTETYKVAYKLFGDVVKKLLKVNIERLKLPIRVEGNKLFFRKVKSNMSSVKEALEILINLLNEKFSELA